MRRYIIASHSNFAKGLEDVLDFFTSQGEKINVVSAYVDDNNFPEEDVKTLFNQFDKSDEVIVMTDLLSGSVNQKFSKYCGRNVYVVAGVNLALAMSLLLIPENTSLSNDLIQENIDQARDQMTLMNTYTAIDDDDE